MGNKQVLKKDKQKTYLLQTCEEHESSINCMEVSEDGSVLATGSDDSNIRLWSTKTDLVECIGLLEGHEDYITSLLIMDNYIFSSSADKTIRKWDMSSCECILVFLGHDSTVNKIISSDDYLFSVSYDKKVRCWDFETAECLRIFSGHRNNVTSLLFIQAEKKRFKPKVKEVRENYNKRTNWKNNYYDNDDKSQDAEEDDQDMSDKDLIITGALDSLAKSWCIQTGECVKTFKGHESAITCMANDPLGKLLFTGSSDHTIRSWEIATGQLLKIFTGHQTTVISLLARRKVLYSTSADHTARSWVMEFGDCTRVYKEHDHSVSCVTENEGLSKYLIS